MSARPSVIVVGAGISGLSAAHRLQAMGCTTRVLESSSRTGGRMSSRRHQGFTINRAANILPTSYRAVADLVDELGMGQQIRAVPGVLAVPRGGRLHRLRPAGRRLVSDALTTGLLSGRAKAGLVRMAADAVRLRSSLSYANLGRAAGFDTMTAAEYCDRHLSSEAYTYLVDPIVRALFTTDADRVSIVDFFFAAVNFVGAGFWQYGGGTGFVTDALASVLDVKTGVEVTEILEEEDRVVVSCEDRSGTRQESADAVVVATTAGVAGTLCPGLDPCIRQVLTSRIEYGSTLVAHIGLRSRPASDAMVIPVPRPVHPDLCVITQDHLLSPTAAPPGAGLISTYWLDRWSQRHRHTPDEVLAPSVVDALESVLPGLSGSVEFVTFDRWSPSVVRSYPGHYRRIAWLADALQRQGRIQLAGDYLTASSVNGCLVSAEAASARTARVLGLSE